MYALPVRSMLYPNEQLPPYSPRWDPETSSILSSAPSYTSAAPSYHSAVPSYHTTDNDNDTIHGGQREAGSWGTSNSYSRNYSSCIFNLNSEPTSTSTPETASSQRQHQGGSTSRLPSPDYAPGFESRALRHGNPSDTQLRMLYNTSSWVPVNNGLQSRAYENVARRRAQRTQAEAMLLRSRGIPGGFQSLTDVSRLEGLGRQRSTTNLAAAAAVVSSTTSSSSSSSTREAVVTATTGTESLRSPLTNALYGLMNASTTSVAATVRGEEPSAHIATPAQREHSVEPPEQIPEEEDDGPVSPHEDPFLVGEEAAARARNQRLYITSQTHENHLHGILTTAVPDTVFGVSRPTTPFAGERNRQRGQSDAGCSPSTARPQYTSLVEQGLQARAQRSRSASTSNVPTTSASNNTTITNSRSPSISIQTPTPTRPRLNWSRTRSYSASPCPSSATLSPPPPTFRVTGAPASSASSSLSPPTPSVKLTSASCTNLLPVTPESDEEHLQVIPDTHPATGRSSSPSNNDTPFPLSSFLPPHRRRPSRTGRSRSPMTTESRSSSSSLLPPLRASVTAPQERTRRSDSADSSTSSEYNGRVSPSQEAMLIAQESKQWDFMMSQMADWEERQRTWKKYREDMERKFCSGRRLGFHGIIGWSPFHGHSLRSAAKKEEKMRGRKRAVSNGAQTSGSWRRRVVGLPA